MKAKSRRSPAARWLLIGAATMLALAHGLGAAGGSLLFGSVSERLPNFDPDPDDWMVALVHGGFVIWLVTPITAVAAVALLPSTWRASKCCGALSVAALISVAASWWDAAGWIGLVPIVPAAAAALVVLPASAILGYRRRMRLLDADSNEGRINAK